MEMAADGETALPQTSFGSSELPEINQPKIRKDFPESWIYEYIDEIGLVLSRNIF